MNNIKRAILVGKEVVFINDISLWAKWFENSKERIVKRDELEDGTLISTVFLGANHDHRGLTEDGIWFETMIFGLDYFENFMDRYSTYDDAVSGHEMAVLAVKQYLARPKDEK